MEKENTQVLYAPEALDLLLWGEFRDGLESLIDVPVSLFDSNGTLLSPSSREHGVCSAIKSRPEGLARCTDVIARAIAQSLEKNKVHIYKCHANQHIFAVPVAFSSGQSYVIIGGHAYLAGQEAAEFAEGVKCFNFAEAALVAMREGLKTIPPRSVFAIPGIVNNLASPFLKCLRSMGPPPSVLSNGGSRAFSALERVFRSIAPVLDREELYETILLKSSELVGAERGSLFILDNKNNSLSVKAIKGLDGEALKGLKLRVGEGISGTTASKGLPLVVRDIEKEVPHRKNAARYKTKSFISLPLKLDNRVIGVINVSDKITGEVFSDEDLQLLLSFANYASIALERGAYYSMSEELKMLSMTDPLTGLFNRRYFRERLFEETERVKRHSECFTVFMIDIDDFKSINDRYGHLAGDEILKGVSRAIRDGVRSMDVVARYGGEEFAVILPHTNKKDSFVIAERIRRKVETLNPGGGIISHWPTVSVGVAEYPRDAASIDDLLGKADKAMYGAKKAGKNRIVVYEG